MDKTLTVFLFLTASTLSAQTQDNGQRTTPSISAVTSRTFHGSGAPGSVTGNLSGDIYNDLTNHISYICMAAFGTSAPACTAVAPAGWQQVVGQQFNVMNYGAVVGSDASTAFIAAAKACATAGAGAITYPATPLASPWQVSVVLPLASHCHWWPAPGSELDETGNHTDLFESMVLTGGTFVPIYGYGGSVITNPYATYGTGSTTGAIDTGIECTGPCTFDGLIDGKTGSANDSKAINFYGTSLHLNGGPITFKHFHGDCIVADFSNTPPVSWGFEDLLHNVVINHCGSDDAGTISVPDAIGLVVSGPTDARLSNLEISQNACWNMYFVGNGNSPQINKIHLGGVNTSSTGCGNILNETAYFMCSECEVEGGVNVPQVVDNGYQMEFYSGHIFQSGGVSSEVSDFQFGQNAGDTSFSRSLYQTTPGALATASAATAVTASRWLLGTDVMMFGNVNNQGCWYFRNENTGYNGSACYADSGSTQYARGSLNSASGDVNAARGYGISGCAGALINCEPATQTLSNGATIFWFYNPGNLPAIPIPVSPTAAYTGIIVDTGKIGGQQLQIINTSIYTLVPAASGTSHMAAARVSSGIVPGINVYVWDSNTSLWQ